MHARNSFRWLFIITLLLVVALVWIVTSTSPVLAQCETPPKSSCISCHEQVGHVDGMGEWNNVHIRQDLCTNCHGGNGSTMDEPLAHEGVVAQPLSDIYTNCHSCHPADYLARSGQLAATLNVTPGSCATPTAFAIYGESGGSHTGSIAMSSDNTGAIPSWESFASIAVMLVSLAFFLLGLGWLDNHRVEG